VCCHRGTCALIMCVVFKLYESITDLICHMVLNVLAFDCINYQGLKYTVRLTVLKGGQICDMEPSSFE